MVPVREVHKKETLPCGVVTKLSGIISTTENNRSLEFHHREREISSSKQLVTFSPCATAANDKVLQTIQATSIILQSTPTTG